MKNPNVYSEAPYDNRFGIAIYLIQADVNSLERPGKDQQAIFDDFQSLRNPGTPVQTISEESYFQYYTFVIKYYLRVSRK